MSRYVLPLLAVVVLIGFLVIGLTRGDPRALPSPFIGKPAPAVRTADTRRIRQ